MRKSKHYKAIVHHAGLLRQHVGKTVHIKFDATFSPYSWSISIDGFLMFNSNLTGQELIYYMRGILQGSDFQKGYKL